jgi:60 kDa SS-A/Ro ribonucleoprotein
VTDLWPYIVPKPCRRPRCGANAADERAGIDPVGELLLNKGVFDMASKNLFKSAKKGKAAPETDTLNEAGGRAYTFSAEHALAQYACTGCLNSTYYATDDEQLNKTLELAQKVSADFLARVCVYAREQGFMKDMPALLLSVLATKDLALFKKIFHRVINNAKMLQNFIQILRSGVVGRKSFGNAIKVCCQEWFERRSPEAIFKSDIGQSPSLADIIKMVHPRPKNKTYDALYGYIIGKVGVGTLDKWDDLPLIVHHFERFKEDKKGEVPDVPFQLLTSLDLGKREWKAIAKNAPWQMTRMNLQTFNRHGVFEDGKMVELIAGRLKDAEAISKAKVFPYQLLMAYKMADGLPPKISDALQDAMEVATSNVPSLGNNKLVVVCPDVSGSMSSPVTGHRKGSTTKVNCQDISALVSACIMRQNKYCMVMPFEESVIPQSRLKLNPRDSVMTNAEKLSKVGGGGTNCSAPLEVILQGNVPVDVCIYVSDNMSWADFYGPYYLYTSDSSPGTATMQLWNQIKAKNPKAKLVLIDIQANSSTQAKDSEDILNIGGFSDRIWPVVESFVKCESKDHWTDVINRIDI